jgi:hypothetical protein
MMDDLGAGLGLEAALPGWDEGSTGDDLAGGVDRADAPEDAIGDGVFGVI